MKEDSKQNTEDYKVTINRLQSLLDNIQRITQTGRWEINLQSNNLFWTSEIYNIFELDPQKQPTIKDISNIIGTPEKDVFENALNLASNEGIPFDLEFSFLKKNDHKTWIRIIGDSLLKNNKIESVHGFVQDITQYKNTELAFIESKEKYKTLTGQLPLGVYRTTEDGQILYANPALVNILGYDNFESLAKISIIETYVEKAKREEQIKKWKETARVHTSEHQVKRKNGEIIWVRDTGQAIRNENGRILYFDGIIEDITNIKTAQDALRESERTTRVILNSSVDCIILINKEGIILDLNDTFLDLIQSQPEELIGSLYYDLFEKNIADIRQKQIDYTFRQKKKIEFEDKVDGYSYENHVFPIFDEEDEVTKAVVFSKDITNQKEYERDLIKAKEKAEEADQLKSAFLANMSHEIRTPMNSIIGFSKLIDNPDLDDEKRKQFTKIIRERTRDLLQIIDEILDISKIESAQMSVTESIVSLNHILDEMYSFFFSKINEEEGKDITLYIKKLFRTSEGSILTDGVKLKQILINLIDNAIKFTKQGEILVGCNIENDEVQFFVKDTGIGISPEKQEIIFDRFRQSEEFSTRRYGGPGLGLAISKGLVELLHGKIWLESIQGVGSSFYFTIPYRWQDTEPINDNGPLADEMYNWSKYSILIVEDDNISQQYLSEVLVDTGVNLLVASNGFDALEIIKSNQVDLILMDIQLPEMDGYETTRKVKKINEKLPILAQTAFAMEEDRTRCFNAGCDDFIAKPISPEALLNRIGMHLR